MDELLKQWHVPQATIDAFVRNDITPEQLKYLNEEYLKELCPVLGTRIQIKKKIDEFLEAQAVTETATSVSEVGELAEIAIPSDHCQDISFSIGDIFTPKASTKDFDLKTLLETSPCRKSVLQYYMANNRLDSKRKNRLTDIIIKYLFTSIVNNPLTYDDYNIITGKIISLFPKKTAGTYFTRPIKKSDSGRGKSVPARGKLVDKVRNVLFQSSERKRKPSEDCDLSKRQKLNDITLAQCEDGFLENKWLLGDSAYSCQDYLLTPLLNPVSHGEVRYNEAHIKTRNLIERCFGLWKRRFPVLSLKMRLALENTQAVIKATAVLHNICRQSNLVDIEPEIEVLGKLRCGVATPRKR